MNRYLFFLQFLLIANFSIAQNWQTNTGNYTMGNLGIGIGYIPTNYKLHVEGKLFAQQLQIGYGGTAGQILILDASGNAVWASPVTGSNGWSLAGNTLSGSNQFIGSVSGNYPLRIVANNDTRIIASNVKQSAHSFNRHLFKKSLLLSI